MPRLTESEFLATVDPLPVRVDQDDEPPFDFWPYFSTIPDEDFDGHDFSEGVVMCAWTMPISQYQYLHIQCDTANVFLVLVLDLWRQQVHGHHVLDLRRLYG